MWAPIGIGGVGVVCDLWILWTGAKWLPFVTYNSTSINDNTIRKHYAINTTRWLRILTAVQIWTNIRWGKATQTADTRCYQFVLITNQIDKGYNIAVRRRSSL